MLRQYLLESALAVLLLLALNEVAFSAASFKSGTMHVPEEAVTAFKADSTLERVTVGDIIYYRSDISKGVEPFGLISSLWPNGELFFEFGPTLEQIDKDRFLEHCRVWEDNTPIRCVERTDERNYILVNEHNGSGCLRPDGSPGGQVSCSALGQRRCSDNVTNCPQDLEILETSWDNTRTVPHEIGHALGLIHEHQRPDRDYFVYIVYANIQSGYKGNFALESGAQTYTEYDFQSVMHYGRCSFSTEQSECISDPPDVLDHQTIIARDCGTTVIAGQQPTQLDFDGVSQAYAPNLMSVLQKTRRQSCGVHVYSAEQVNIACPTGCAEAGSILYTKIEEDYESTCGFLVVRDGVKYCRNKYDKEFIRQWTDSDTHIDCPLGTKNERWIQCGCSQQPLVASCYDHEADIVESNLSRLLESSDGRDREAGRLLQMIISFIDVNQAEPGLVQGVARLMLLNYPHPAFTNAVHNFRCQAAVLVAAQRMYNANYKLSMTDISRLAKSNGLRAN